MPPGSRRRYGSRRRIESADAKEVFLVSCGIQTEVANVTSKGKEKAKPQKKEDEGTDEEADTRCICSGEGEGEMVACDGCHRWFHLVCMDIRSSDELEDQWFCAECVEDIVRTQAPPPPQISEPVLVPSSDEPTSSSSTSLRLPFYQVHDSPSSNQYSPYPPRTPYGNSSSHYQTPGASSSRLRTNIRVDRSRNPVTPTRAKRGAGRSWGNQGFFEDVAAAPDSPFDPTSTPSRGVRVATSLIGAGTPQGLPTWSSRMNLLHTPLQRHAGGLGQRETTTPRRVLDFNYYNTPQSTWSISPLAPAPTHENMNNSSTIHEFGGMLGGVDFEESPDVKEENMDVDGPNGSNGQFKETNGDA